MLNKYKYTHIPGLLPQMTHGFAWEDLLKLFVLQGRPSNDQSLTP